MFDMLASKQERSLHPRWVIWFVPFSLISVAFSMVVLALFFFDVINLKEFLIIGGVAGVFLATFTMPTIVYFDKHEKLQRSIRN